MTAEERIAQLEALVAEKDRMLAIQAQALADAMAAVRAAADDRKAIEARRAGDRERRRRADEEKRRHALEAIASRDVTTADSRESHVSGFPPPLDGSPPSSKPSSPSPLSSPPSLSASQEPVQGELVSVQPAERRVRQRAPSAAEALFRKIQETREARCVEVGEAVVPERWDVARQNKVIGELLKESEEARQRFEAAWGLYLADDGERVREPAWSLSWFMSSGVRARYETRAAREGT